jgi:hypothetical protein
MAKIIDEGLAPPGHPIYKQGWSSYIGPRQNELIEKPTNNTPQTPPSETTKPSEAAEKPVAEAAAEAEPTEE